MNKLDLEFKSKGLKCVADLYLPENKEKPPVIIMAHGFGAERSFILPQIAEKFIKLGWAVLVFDYRYSGDSEGEPRNLVNPWKQLEDWDSAINFIKTIEEVDSKKIVLWGTSFSGGHVLVKAAKRKDIMGVIAQVPLVDGLANALTYSPYYILKGAAFSIIDNALSFFKKDYFVKIFSNEEEFAIMNKIDSRDFLDFIPKNSKWENRCPARIISMVPLYRPIITVKKIKCPVLLIGAINDTLIPIEVLKKAAGEIEKCKAVYLPMNHFEVYGKFFDEVMKIEEGFLREILP